MNHAQIARNIKQLCKQQGATLASLYDAVGVSHTFLFDLEKRHSPSFATMIKIADFLNCSLDELAGRTKGE